MKSLLVPIKFDLKSAGVLAYSVSLARELGLNIKLLHILVAQETPAPVEAHAGSLSYNMPIGDLLNERLKQGEKKLKALANRVKNESNVNCDYTCKPGFTDIQILEESEKDNIAMVIMGTPQHHTLYRQLLGSSSLKILNHGEIPVLLVPNNTAYFPIKNIVVGASYEGHKHFKSSWLMKIARKLKARLHFIHVVKEKNHQERLMFKGYKKEMDEQLQKELKYSFKLVEEESVDQGLRNYRQSNQADLIALRRSKKSSWDHLFSENVSKEMAMETSVPLLVY